MAESLTDAELDAIAGRLSPGEFTIRGEALREADPWLVVEVLLTEVRRMRVMARAAVTEARGDHAPSGEVHWLETLLGEPCSDPTNCSWRDKDWHLG